MKRYKSASLYLFAESEGQPAQVVLRVEFIGLLFECREAEEVKRALLHTCLQSLKASLPRWYSA